MTKNLTLKDLTRMKYTLKFVPTMPSTLTRGQLTNDRVNKYITSKQQTALQTLFSEATTFAVVKTYGVNGYALMDDREDYVFRIEIKQNVSPIFYYDKDATSVRLVFMVKGVYYKRTQPVPPRRSSAAPSRRQVPSARNRRQFEYEKVPDVYIREGIFTVVIDPQAGDKKREPIVFGNEDLNDGMQNAQGGAVAFESRTKAELVALCRAKKIVYSGKTKAELVTALHGQK